MRSRICVVRMERIIVIGVAPVNVIVERGIAMHVGMIAMVEVGVAMTVDVRRSVRVVVVRRSVPVRDVGVRRRI